MISNRIIPRREQLSRRDSTSTRDATSTAFATFFPSSGKLYHGTGPVERGNGNNIPVSQPFVLRVMLMKVKAHVRKEKIFCKLCKSVECLSGTLLPSTLLVV